MLEAGENSGYNHSVSIIMIVQIRCDGLMNKKKILHLLAVSVFFTLAGCGEPIKAPASEPLCRLGLEKSQAMQIAERTLGEMGFKIEKADAEAALIRTRPLPGAQVFEFWRKDNASAFAASEANIQTIRRIVEIKFTERGEQLCLQCSVETQRLSLPERRVNSTSDAYIMFSESDSVLQKLELSDEQRKGMAWISLGRDSQLEERILGRIRKNLD